MAFSSSSWNTATYCGQVAFPKVLGGAGFVCEDLVDGLLPSLHLCLICRSSNSVWRFRSGLFFVWAILVLSVAVVEVSQVDYSVACRPDQSGAARGPGLAWRKMAEAGWGFSMAFALQWELIGSMLN